MTLPGAGVWHADFAWKNWDDWSRYFAFRNALITAALHSDFDRQSIVDHLAGLLTDYVVSMRYGLAELTIKAIEDFLRGPEVLARRRRGDRRPSSASCGRSTRRPPTTRPGPCRASPPSPCRGRRRPDGPR